MTTPDLTSYRAIHNALRRGARRLSLATAVYDGDPHQCAAIARYWKGYSTEVLAHHGLEDEYFFPSLAAKVPVAGRHIPRIERDHHDLDLLMDASTKAISAVTAGGDASDAARYLAELSDLMDRHLDFEDEDLLPLFERHFPADEYKALEDTAMKSIGFGRQAAFTVPFALFWLTDDQRDAVFAQAPGAFKVLWRLTRRSHARLAERALRDAALRPLETV